MRSSTRVGPGKALLWRKLMRARTHLQQRKRFRNPWTNARKAKSHSLLLCQSFLPEGDTGEAENRGHMTSDDEFEAVLTDSDVWQTSESSHCHGPSKAVSACSL